MESLGPDPEKDRGLSVLGRSFGRSSAEGAIEHGANRFDSVANAQFSVAAAEVELNRHFLDGQFAGNLFVGLAGGERPQDFDLTAGQPMLLTIRKRRRGG